MCNGRAIHTDSHRDCSGVKGLSMGSGGGKKSCRDRGESLTVHRAHGVGHRNERLQLTESFLERRERRIRRFELPGGLGGTLSVANQ